MILGIGTDVVEVERVRGLLHRHGPRFTSKAFTEIESAYCGAQADPAVHFAGRFAAKEAVLKALGTGLGGGVTWRDVEVVPGEGTPRVRLSGRAAEAARALGAGEAVMVSIAHVPSVAVAVALLQGGPPAP